MEVGIVESTNVPQDYVISIRFGDVRRQAPLEKLRRRPLKFPSIGDALAEPIKVEVLRVVAVSRVVLQPGEASYKVSLGCEGEHGASMGLGLHVNSGTPASHTAGANIRLASDIQPRETSVFPPALSSRYEDVAEKARDYLEVHGLVQYVQALLQAVVWAKPDDPYKFMMGQLGSAYPLRKTVVPNTVVPAVSKAVPPSASTTPHLDATSASAPVSAAAAATAVAAAAAPEAFLQPAIAPSAVLPSVNSAAHLTRPLIPSAAVQPKDVPATSSMGRESESNEPGMKFDKAERLEHQEANILEELPPPVAASSRVADNVLPSSEGEPPQTKCQTQYHEDSVPQLPSKSVMRPPEGKLPQLPVKSVMRCQRVERSQPSTKSLMSTLDSEPVLQSKKSIAPDPEGETPCLEPPESDGFSHSLVNASANAYVPGVMARDSTKGLRGQLETQFIEHTIALEREAPIHLLETPTVPDASVPDDWEDFEYLKPRLRDALESMLSAGRLGESLRESAPSLPEDPVDSSQEVV